MRKTDAERREIAQRMAAADLGLLVLSTPYEVLRFGRGGVPAEAPPAAPTPRHAPTVVRSPSVGILLLRHPGRTEPLAAMGLRVCEGQPLALLRIGPLLLPVAAPAAGRVVAVHAAEGAPVGFGAPLFDFEIS